MDVVVPTDLARYERITAVEFLNGGEVRATWLPPQNATTVTVDKPVDTTIGGKTLERVSWSAVGGQPLFNVQVGPSRSGPWQTVAVGLTTTSFDIDPPATWTREWVTPKLPQLMVRVMATNGVDAVFSAPRALAEPAPKAP